MNKQSLTEIASALAELQGERMRLGKFDANADAILTLTSALLSITEHLRDKEKK